VTPTSTKNHVARPATTLGLQARAAPLAGAPVSEAAARLLAVVGIAAIAVIPRRGRAGPP
jgi:hypothetical protein